MISTEFDYFAPTSVAEATELLSSHGENAKILAGGHSLIPLMKLRLAQPGVLIDLGKIDSLSYISENGGGISIGAMTTYAQIQSSDTLMSKVPILPEAAAQVADQQIRNMGTIGGSLAHADPAGDLPAVVLALGAQLVTSSTGSHRTIAVDDFFVDLLTTALEPTEILSEIQIPSLPDRTGTSYMKFGNKASHYAIVGVAAVVTKGADGSCADVKIGVTGAGPKAVRAFEAEAALKGSSLDDAAIQSAAEKAGAGIDFNSDVHASDEFRAHLTIVMAKRAIAQAASRAG